MAQRVASILAEIGIDDAKFKSGAQSILGGLDEITGSMGLSLGSAASLAGGIALLTEQYNLAAEAATNAAREQAKMEAVIKATGGAAGFTAAELSILADETARLTGIDDDIVKSAQSVMLTFKNISGDNFKEAMIAAADLSAVMGTDLTGAAMQVSKALNDFDGYTALKRAGVSFTDEQEKQIRNFRETNNLAAYQALVLRELQGEFGGAAEAINAAGDGSQNLNNEIGNLYENVGTLLLPEIRQFNRELTSLIHTINENFEAVARLYGALQGLMRVVMAISTLGVSELLRWWMNGGGDSATPPPGAGALPSNKSNAVGGSFLIPQSYGREGFRLGNGDTASAGERVTITPQFAQAGGASIVVENVTIGDTSSFTRGDVTEMIQTAMERIMYS